LCYDRKRLQYILQIPFFFQDPELEARVQRLKAEAEAREYRRMTENVDCAVSHFLVCISLDKPLISGLRKKKDARFIRATHDFTIT
jgi:hypothetical protein